MDQLERKVLAAINSVKHQFSQVPAVPTQPDLAILRDLIPLRSYDQFEDFNEKLKTDIDLRKALVSYL